MHILLYTIYVRARVIVVLPWNVERSWPGFENKGTERQMTKKHAVSRPGGISKHQELVRQVSEGQSTMINISLLHKALSTSIPRSSVAVTSRLYWLVEIQLLCWRTFLSDLLDGIQHYPSRAKMDRLVFLHMLEEARIFRFPYEHWFSPFPCSIDNESNCDSQLRFLATFTLLSFLSKNPFVGRAFQKQLVASRFQISAFE